MEQSPTNVNEMEIFYYGSYHYMPFQGHTLDINQHVHDSQWALQCSK
uniref:Uncharacterized protein n=1 Tax=Arundo donax TaxID=35708 RepID=A0A0A9AF90_ARUDO